MNSGKNQYVFRHNETGEIVIFQRIKGEYREVCDYDLWRNNKRLYPCLRITTVSLLVTELVQLDYYLIDVRKK